MFIVIAIASMAAILEFIATIPRLLCALFFSTVAISGAHEYSTTESAFLSLFIFFVLLACLPEMIWLFSARLAEVFLTFRTPNTVLAHVLSGSLINDLTLVILNVVIDFSNNKFDKIAALALHDIFVAFECLAGKSNHK